MELAKKYFSEHEYEVEDVSASQPYDLHCQKDIEILYIEVKGTQSSGKEVRLTANEVKFAREHSEEMVLFIVHSIEVIKNGEEPATRGGIQKIVRPWIIEDDALEPTAYRYHVPD